MPIWCQSGPVWCYLGLSGAVWDQSGANLDVPNAIWPSLRLSGANLVPIWACLVLSGPLWGCLGPIWCQSAPVWCYLDLSGLVWSQSYANLGNLVVFSRIDGAWSKGSPDVLRVGAAGGRKDCRIFTYKWKQLIRRRANLGLYGANLVPIWACLVLSGSLWCCLVPIWYQSGPVLCQSGPV